MRITWIALPLVLLAGCGAPAPRNAAHHRVASKTTLDRDPAKPVATVRGSIRGTSLGLISLRRYGPKVVTAKVRLSTSPDTPTFIDTVQLELGVDASSDVRGMRLVDEVNGREHFVLESQDGECLCSSFDGVGKATTVDLYAKFPAPPADVEFVSLHVPGFPSFDNVRIAS